MTTDLNIYTVLLDNSNQIYDNQQSLKKGFNLSSTETHYGNYKLKYW